MSTEILNKLRKIQENTGPDGIGGSIEQRLGDIVELLKIQNALIAEAHGIKLDEHETNF